MSNDEDQSTPMTEIISPSAMIFSPRTGGLVDQNPPARGDAPAYFIPDPNTLYGKIIAQSGLLMRFLMQEDLVLFAAQKRLDALNEMEECKT